ncbi:transcription termination factor MTEF18, mitochondrial-like [Triticum dicoccoides]|uniref:transcription termination factor MTEF18, mitochondrial-like n=1 Tax=Triticum dicoccoides TaxID=85692 RepID=UPI001891B6E5|nr:transcription termination factor MTEF18, mitochondrial-like [Triticum dicoccoides]
MLRLRECVVSRLLSPSSNSAISPLLLRLLSASASAAPIPPNPSEFAVEEYLVDTCGLTRPQALKAFTKLSHLNSPANPNAVLTFLAGLGLSGADAAAAVAKDPRLLCAKVDKTLAPVVDGLTGLGLSRPDIARLVSLTPDRFRRRSIVSKMHYYLTLFGSFQSFIRTLKRSSHLLSSDLDKLVKPNVAFLRECGLGDCDIAKLCIAVPWMLATNPERVRAMVACAERLGVPHGAGMFRQALQAVVFLNEEKINAKLDYLKKTFRWSDAEVSIAVCKAPMVLRKSKESLKHRSEFLFSEVGLEPVYVAHRPVILCLSLEGRVRPRYYVLKFLKENGLVDRKLSFHTAVMMTEKVFVEKFICPHKEAAPHLAGDYATACKGEVPTSSIIFR